MYSRYAELRDSKGYTDYKVAKLTGISAVTLCEWKKGFYKPKADKMLLLAKLFDVPVEVFIREGD